MVWKSIDRFVVDLEKGVGYDKNSGSVVLVQMVNKKVRHVESIVVRECKVQQTLAAHSVSGVLTLLELLEDSVNFYFFYENPAPTTPPPPLQQYPAPDNNVCDMESDETALARKKFKYEVNNNDNKNIYPAFQQAAAAPSSQNIRNTMVDLLTCIKQSGRLSEQLAGWIFLQLMKTLAEMHALDIVHRDLKLPSILICTETNQMKLTNFGCSQILESPNALLTDRKGSPAYLSPEIFQKNTIAYDGKAADVYACGVILYCMLTGGYPFAASSPETLFRLVSTQTPSIPDYVSPNMTKLVLNLLQKQPTDRPTSGQIVEQYSSACVSSLVPVTPLPMLQLRLEISGTMLKPDASGSSRHHARKQGKSGSASRKQLHHHRSHSSPPSQQCSKCDSASDIIDAEEASEMMEGVMFKEEPEVHAYSSAGNDPRELHAAKTLISLVGTVQPKLHPMEQISC